MKVNIVTGFESSNIHNVRQVDGNHFACEMIREEPTIFRYPDHHGYWFCLRMDGAAGQQITVDIVNCDWMPSHWKRYRPVVTYTDPSMFGANEWETIESARQFRKTFRFIHVYKKNTAWVALRYPYTYSYHQNYLESLRDIQYVLRETIHVTKGGRNLDALTITDPRTPDLIKRKIVIYAREHAVEQEGSWVCQGAINFLVSDAPEAASLRKGAVILIIPMCAPDAAYHGRCTDPVTGQLVSCDFQMRDYGEMVMDESRAIWNKVASVASQGTIDLCLSLHSPHGWEANIWTNLHDSIRRQEGKLLNSAIFSFCRKYSTRGPEYRWGKFSLPGRCAKEFGSIALLMEINQHAKGSTLTLDQLRDIGGAVCRGIENYFMANKRKDADGKPSFVL